MRAGRGLLNRISFEHAGGDIAGGVTAAVVALPLALAFGVASGAGAVAGLYGAIWTGLFSALFGGTRTQISGPTGPMTVVAAAVFTRYGQDPSIAFTIFMLGGGLQILFGTLKFGRYISLMPYPVVSGFMTGIGGIILIIQAAPLLGHTSPPGILNDLAHLPGYLVTAVPDALAVGGLALVITFGWRGRLARFVPPPLLALIVGTAAGLLLFPAAPTIGPIPSGLPTPQIPNIPMEALGDVLVSALVLALLGAIDSLLTSVIVDQVTNTSHDPDRELRGQGIGNLVAGVLGAIPGAGATMRTMANVRAGGRSELSGVIHGLLLLAVALGLGAAASHIPLAVLAGILVKVGVDIIDWGYLRRLRTAPREGVVMMLVVAGLTIFVDLITAVAVGVVMASLLFVKRMADLQIESVQAVSEDDERALSPEERAAYQRCSGRALLVRFSGPLSFGVASGMVRKVSQLRSSEVLILDLTEVSMVDSSATLALEQIIRGAQNDGLQVLLAGITAQVARTFVRLGVLDLVRELDRYPDRRSALEAAADIPGTA